MGNNNTSLQNDKNTGGAMVCHIHSKKMTNKFTAKNGQKCPPDCSFSNIEEDPSPEETVSEPITTLRAIRTRLGSGGDRFGWNRKISPTQQIFLDNVILPLGNEINARIKKTQNVTNLAKKILDKKCTSDANLCKCTHHRAPAGSSRSLNPNVAALIAGMDDKDGGKKYPVVFEYNGEAEEVFLSGSFNNWEKIKMGKMERQIHGMKDFITVLELKKGNGNYICNFFKYKL
jgi:hypothetical protein